MVEEATLRSFTSLIKKDKMPQVNTWEPMDFTTQSSIDEEELLMYAEGVTEPQTWIPPEERSDQEKASIWKRQASLSEDRQGIINVLVEKIKGSATSPVFKRNEIHVQPFDLPEIELLQEKPQEEDLSVEAEPEEEQILPEQILEEAKHQAQQILEQAKAEAEVYLAQIRNQAQAESEQRIEQAKAEAAQIIFQANQSREAITQEAIKKGLEAAREEARHFIQTAQSLIEGLEKTHDLILERSEDEVIQLVKTIIENLFANGAALPENVLKETFQRAVEEAKPLGNLRIRANPQDIAVLGDLWLEEQKQLRNITVEWLPSEDILRGGCVIEGDFGSLDARVDLKLDRILQKIDEVKHLPTDIQSKEDSSKDETSLIQEMFTNQEQQDILERSESVDENSAEITNDNNFEGFSEELVLPEGEGTDEVPLNFSF